MSRISAELIRSRLGPPQGRESREEISQQDAKTRRRQGIFSSGAGARVFTELLEMAVESGEPVVIDLEEYTLHITVSQK